MSKKIDIRKHTLVPKAQKLSEKGAKRVLPLQVHGAFHSGLMISAREKLKPYILATPFKNSSPLIMMNASAQLTENAQHIQLGLIEQITASVRWEQSICRMESHSPDLYIEVGCGKTLARLNKQIGVTAPSISIDKVEDLITLESTLQSLPQKH